MALSAHQTLTLASGDGASDASIDRAWKQTSLEYVCCTVECAGSRRQTRLSSGAKALYHFSDHWSSTIHIKSRTHGSDQAGLAEERQMLAASVE
jgi:hypothetical protein